MWIYAQRLREVSYRMGESAMAKGSRPPPAESASMPFDTAHTADALQFAPAADLDAAFDAAGDMDVAWAMENPERAMAVLMVAPRPCAALDALLGL